MIVPRCLKKMRCTSSVLLKQSMLNYCRSGKHTCYARLISFSDLVPNLSSQPLKRHFHNFRFSAFTLDFKSRSNRTIYKCLKFVNREEIICRHYSRDVKKKKNSRWEKMFSENGVAGTLELDRYHSVFEENKAYHKWLILTENPWQINDSQSGDSEFRQKDIYLSPSEVAEFDAVTMSESFSLKQTVDLLDSMASFPVEKVLSALETDVFQEFLFKIGSNLPSMSDKQLFILSKHLAKLPFRISVKKERGQLLHEEFCSRVSEEFLVRTASWDRDTRLLAADMVYWLHAHPPFYNTTTKTYLQTVLERCTEHWRTWSRHEVVLMYFYTSLLTRCPASLIKLLENRTLEHWSDFTSDEINIICFGHFKGYLHINSEDLLMKMVETLNLLTANKDDYVMGTLCRVVSRSLNDRYSNEAIGQITQMLSRFLTSEHLLSRIPDMDIRSLIKIMKMSLHVREMSAPVLEAFADVVSRDMREELKFWRIKDIAWALLILAQFQYGVSNNNVKGAVYDKLYSVFQNKKRLNWALKYHHSTVIIAMVALLYVQVFPEDLINQTLVQKAMNRFQIKGNDFERNVIIPLFLSEAVKLESSHCDYVEDDDQEDENSMRDLFRTIPKSPQLCQDWDEKKYRRSVRQVLQNVIPSRQKCFKLHRLLPYTFIEDFEIRFDKNKEPIPVIQWMMQEPEMKNYEYRLAILVNSPQWYYKYWDGQNPQMKLLGFHVTRIRHLQKKGFRTIEINPHMYQDLYKKSSVDHQKAANALTETLTEAVNHALQI